ncbi:hypothetical protein FOA52_007021 [Chlamydomonas sp. UWO 241]|nr:hypothetical protein FOA52_007021 [Chlamydomonas sp. UWO 241]
MATSPGGEWSDLGARLCASSSASVISALVVTPLDVIKTRMQAPGAGMGGMLSAAVRSVSGGPSPAAACVMQASRGSLFLRALPSAAMCPTCASMVSSLAAIGPTGLEGTNRGPVPSTSQRSMPGMLSFIVRKGGVLSLWRGLDAAIAHSIPMIGIYMPLYDYLQGQLSPSLGVYSPALAGAAARGVAAAATAPLELIRVRQQASHGPATWRAVLGGTSPAGSAPGRQLRGLYTGLGASLSRDVPFTAIYWFAVEPIRARLLADSAATVAAAAAELHALPSHGAAGQAPPPAGAAAVPTRDLLRANIVAGSVAGALAAAATTPMDVAKTRLQTRSVPPPAPGGAAQACLGAARRLSTLDMLRLVWHTEGARGLFVGIGPRVARAVPACAITVSTYELVKAALL